MPHGLGRTRVGFDEARGAGYGHRTLHSVPGSGPGMARPSPLRPASALAALASPRGKRTFRIDSASLMPADNMRGLRSDVVQAVKSLSARGARLYARLERPMRARAREDLALGKIEAKRFTVARRVPRPLVPQMRLTVRRQQLSVRQANDVHLTRSAPQPRIL